MNEKPKFGIHSCYISTYSISYSLLTDMNSWSVTMREDHRLRVLRKIFKPKRGVVIGE
jgi:hypothetical protein